ncbi:aldose epimerase [Terriglobus sp. RCC_193]|uniref:aldose epimerase family protein n=1 Tax=Terriglobus sp. RCC_193 TaxID=3239218 RepID=UPI0035241315
MPSQVHRCILQSDQLVIEVRPREGGRIASLRSLDSGLEFLMQSPRNETIPTPNLNADFRNGPCAGIEECLPTVARCDASTEGGPAPDHGDFWQLPWHVEHMDDCSAILSADGFSRTLRFTKHLLVTGDTLRVEYSVTNIRTTSQSFLYACHPLFAVDEGDLIMLPSDIRSLRLDYSRGNRLGKRGDVISWPVTASGIKLDQAGRADVGHADMFYTERVNRGVCGILRYSTGQILEVLFDPARLPYLGIWLCYGGWPDDATEQLQYAVALEPTTSPHNSLNTAQQAQAAMSLQPGKVFRFAIAFRVRQAPSALLATD